MWRTHDYWWGGGGGGSGFICQLWDLLKPFVLLLSPPDTWSLCHLRCIPRYCRSILSLASASVLLTHLLSQQQINERHATFNRKISSIFDHIFAVERTSGNRQFLPFASVVCHVFRETSRLLENCDCLDCILCRVAEIGKKWNVSYEAGDDVISTVSWIWYKNRKYETTLDFQLSQRLTVITYYEASNARKFYNRRTTPKRPNFDCQYKEEA